MRNTIIFAAAACAALLVSGCPLDSELPPATCTYGGKTYAEGASFPSTDGCNTCSCGFDGQVACTERACLPADAGADGGAAPVGCAYGGKTYKVGESFPSTDGCNSCACTAEGVACTLKACDPGVSAGCSYGGTVHKFGATFPSTDGCNECTCTEAGVACTKKACLPPPVPEGECRKTGCSGHICADRDQPSTCEWREEYACYREAECKRQMDGRCGFTATDTLKACLAKTAKTCVQDGKTYPIGATFPAADGCNTCTCTEAGPACTRKACLPSPGACRRTGCSGQICSDQDVASTCEWRDEYACYKEAECTRQADGRCGFTPTPALKACLGKTSGACQYGGKTYKAGETFPSTDGCNLCSCGEDGQVACTRRACL